MMGFTADGQHDQAMVAARDQRFGIDTAARRERKNIEAPPIDPGADAWQHGKVFQIADSGSNPHKHAGDRGRRKQGPGSQRPLKQAMTASLRLRVLASYSAAMILEWT
jgi:hypothetical protein